MFIVAKFKNEAAALAFWEKCFSRIGYRAGGGRVFKSGRAVAWLNGSSPEIYDIIKQTAKESKATYISRRYV